VLQPGETVDAQWFTFEEVHNLINKRKMCRVIAHQFLAFEKALLARNEEIS
jgi:NADH pyrophosphatase NudC (nudix superfamily)